MNNNSKAKTPCIGVCSTGIGDVVCRGCKRYAHEVINWNGYSDDERLLIINRLDGFLVTIVGNMIDIFDEDKLLKKMEFQQIQFNRQLSPSRWVFELLRNGASQVRSTEEFGFKIKEDWQRYSLEQIKQFLEQDFFNLSSAHYDRYISI